MHCRTVYQRNRILSVLTSAYCTNYKDSYESALLLSAGLYHYIHPSPLAPAAGTPDSSTHSSTDSSTIYTQYTRAQCTPVAQQ